MLSINHCVVLYVKLCYKIIKNQNEANLALASNVLKMSI